MSHNLSGIFFENQVIASKGMRTLAHRLLSDGVITGCKISYSGASVTIAAGYLLVAGGLMQNPAAQTLSLSGASSGYARIKAVADLSKTATKTKFLQAFFEVEYSSTEDGFATLVQEDINAGGAVYEVELCVATLGSGGVISLMAAPPCAEYNHENLLSNWYFADPVNSRGQTTYAGAGYTIDQWRSNSGKIVKALLAGYGIRLLATGSTYGWAFYQSMEVAPEMAGKMVTASLRAENLGGTSWNFTVSFRDSSGSEIKSATVKAVSGVTVSSAKIPSGTASIFCGVYVSASQYVSDGDSIDLVSAKLELGSVSTLAGDPPPNKNLEEARSSGASAKPVLLWRGEWTAGSLTVAESGGSSGCTGLGNISDYMLLLFVDTDGCVYVIYNTGSRLTGGGSYYSTAEEYAYSFGFSASLSGDTATITANKYSNLSHSERRVGDAWSSIVLIIGLVKTSDIITS